MYFTASKNFLIENEIYIWLFAVYVSTEEKLDTSLSVDHYIQTQKLHLTSSVVFCNGLLTDSVQSSNYNFQRIDW